MPASSRGIAGMDLAKFVTTKERYQWCNGTRFGRKPRIMSRRIAPYHVVAYDFGVKRNILRLLSDLDCRMTVVPATTSAEEAMSLMPDGIFLSNGPGDPEPCDYAIAAIASFLKSGIPVFGICLGHQLMALAAGAKTEKMKFGHHGANHPVQDLDTGQVMITSQNHGFRRGRDHPAGKCCRHTSLTIRWHAAGNCVCRSTGIQFSGASGSQPRAA